MNLREAFDFVASTREAWKTPLGNWRPPFCYNRDHALLHLGANKNVKKITVVDLARMRTALQRENRKPGGINRIMSMVNTVFKTLSDEGIIPKQPKLKPLSEKGSARKEYFTRDDISKMVKVSVEVFDDRELADAIEFGVYTGCRQANLLNLRVEDVDLNTGRMVLRDTKNGEDQILDIHPRLAEILSVRCAIKESSDRVFDFNNKDDLWNRFKKVRALCNLSEKLVWHSLRHTTGTWLSKRGVPIQVIAKVLGHKQITTSQRYTKVADESRKSAINSL